VAADDGAEHGLERRRRGRAVHAAAGRGDALEERAAAEVLHDEDELSVVGDVVLVELDDVGVVELHERRDLRGHRRRRLRRPTRLGPEPAAAVVQEPQVGVPAVVRVLVVHERPGRVPGRGARRRAEPEVRARVPRGHALHGAALHRHRVRRHGHAAVAAAADLAELPVGPFEVVAVAPEAHEPPPRHREARDLVVDGVAAAAVVDEGPRGVPAPRPARVPGLAALPGLARVQADELRDGLVGLVVREAERVVRPHEAVPGQPRVSPGEVEVVDDDPDAAALSQAQPVHDAEDLVDAVAWAGKECEIPNFGGSYFHSFRLIFGRAIISRSALDAWMLVPERARAEYSC
jgi:hypothetical protein